jgi:hypothetical protein
MINLGPIELMIILVICVFLLGLPVAAAIVLARRPKDNARRRPCPYCAEAILPDAQVCRFCSRELPAGWSKNQ